MSEKRVMPREVNVSYVKDYRTGGTHNVLEICAKDRGVRFGMAQDSETAKERDRYKLRAHLVEAENARLVEEVAGLEKSILHEQQQTLSAVGLQAELDDLYEAGWALKKELAALREGFYEALYESEHLDDAKMYASEYLGITKDTKC